MTSRGEFRTWYVAAWDDDEFIALSPLAKLLLRYLKDTLGALGIGRVSSVKAARLLGCTDAELEAAFAMLDAPKPDRAHGWIVRGERGVVWLVNGLRFEQALSPLNEKKHVPYVRRLAEQLDPTLAVVQAFLAHYPEWFAPPSVRALAAADSDEATDADAVADADSHRAAIAYGANPHRVAIAYDAKPDRLSIHERRETGTGDRSSTSDSERAPRARAAGSGQASPASPASPASTASTASPSLARLAALRAEFVDEIYGAAPAARRSAVAEQLDRVLLPEGVRLGRGLVAHATADSLASALAATLQQFRRGELRDRDKAIVVALRKCHSGPANEHRDDDGRLVTEAAVQDQADRERADRRAFADREREALTWLEQHPDEAGDIEARVIELNPGDDRTPGLRMLRATARVQFVEQLRAEFAGARL